MALQPHLADNGTCCIIRRSLLEPHYAYFSATQSSLPCVLIRITVDFSLLCTAERPYLAKKSPFARLGPTAVRKMRSKVKCRALG